MLTIATVIAILAGSAAAWGWHEVTKAQRCLGAFNGFDGMHFER